MSLEDQFEAIEHEMTNHPPLNDNVARALDELTEGAILWAKLIAVHVPVSRGQFLALTKAKESLMWAKAGIACNQDKT